jgi:protease I
MTDDHDRRPERPLEGRRVAFLVANEGIEQSELAEPMRAVRAAGGQAALIAPEPGEAQAMHHLDKGDIFPVDTALEDGPDPSDYDALMLPGGVANPDRLRMDERAVAFVRRFMDEGRPVAAICHAPWLLVQADAVRGRTLTGWPSITTDIENAGGIRVNEEVCRDGNLVTSRSPTDLPAFCEAMVDLFAAAPVRGGDRSAADHVPGA